MVIFRLLSYILIAATLMLLGYDAITWLQTTGGEGHSLYSLGKLINAIAGSDVTANWPGFVQIVLGWPAWAITGVLGIILAFVSRGRG